MADWKAGSIPWVWPRQYNKFPLQRRNLAACREVLHYTAFSYRVPDNHRHSIVIDIEILVPVPIQGYLLNEMVPQKAKALIDTGASRSAIRSTFVQTAKLFSYEKCTIRMAKGEYISSVYSIDVLFPNKMMAKNIKAAEFSGSHEFDFIVGMDILRMTDMAITNARGITVLSLRSPSADEHIDFTKQEDRSTEY